MPEETVRPLTIYVFNLMLKQFIVMNDVFFSSVTGGICGQKKKKCRSLHKNLSASSRWEIHLSFHLFYPPAPADGHAGGTQYIGFEK